jgi:hypothetical protein
MTHLKRFVFCVWTKKHKKEQRLDARTHTQNNTQLGRKHLIYVVNAHLCKLKALQDVNAAIDLWIDNTSQCSMWWRKRARDEKVQMFFWSIFFIYKRTKRENIFLVYLLYFMLYCDIIEHTYIYTHICVYISILFYYSRAGQTRARSVIN